MFAASMSGAMKISVFSTTGLSMPLHSAAKRLSGASSAIGPLRDGIYAAMPTPSHSS
jgi:hypothetical protein